MPSNAEELAASPDVLDARRDVEVAKAELESRLREVSRSSEKALVRVARKARPLLIGVAVVAGVLVVAGALGTASRKRRPALGSRLRPVTEPSLLGVAFGAALRAAVRIAATRATEKAVLRLSTAR